MKPTVSRAIREKLLEANWQAYIVLLRMPFSIRVKYQDTLVKLRDSLALGLKKTEEEVQNKAESIARELGGLI